MIREVRIKGNQAVMENSKNRIVGKKFGRLLVTGYVPGSAGNKPRAICKCDCGNIKIINSCNIKRGLTQSCGCLHKEKTIEASITHNMSATCEYNIWCKMKDRCLNPKRAVYKNYGGRGITICASWLDEEYGFLNFFRDMGKRPSKNLSLDRINNDGNYEPSNCRWATAKQQANNKRQVSLLSRKRNAQGRLI